MIYRYKIPTLPVLSEGTEFRPGDGIWTSKTAKKIAGRDEKKVRNLKQNLSKEGRNLSLQINL